MKLYHLLLCLLILTISTQGFPQKTKEKIPPEYTEVWEPEPPIVTPGEGTAPPSDAIVLFDGSDLSAWTNGKGKEAGWTVENGMATTKPGTGPIMTRQSFGMYNFILNGDPQPKLSEKDREGETAGFSL